MLLTLYTYINDVFHQSLPILHFKFADNALVTRLKYNVVIDGKKATVIAFRLVSLGCAVPLSTISRTWKIGNKKSITK